MSGKVFLSRFSTAVTRSLADVSSQYSLALWAECFMKSCQGSGKENLRPFSLYRKNENICTQSSRFKGPR